MVNFTRMLPELTTEMNAALSGDLEPVDCVLALAGTASAQSDATNAKIFRTVSASMVLRRLRYAFTADRTR